MIGKEQSNKWSFGSPSKGGTKTSKSIGTISPGPGAYNTGSMAFDYKNPKFYLGNKYQNTLEKTNKNPGAGQYNPSFSVTKQQFPSFSLGAKSGSSMVNTSSNF